MDQTPQHHADGASPLHELRLEVTHGFLQTLLQSFSAGIAFIDREFRFRQINQILADMNGFSIEYHLGRKVEEVVPALWPNVEPMYRRVLETGEATTGVELSGEVSSSPGMQRSWLVGYYPVRGSDGSVLGTAIIVNEITEQKKTENALREKDKLLSESQRIARIGSWVYFPTGRFTWSDEAYRIYGRSPDTYDPNNEPFLNLIHPEDRPAVQAWITSSFAGCHPGELEFRTILPDGSIRFLSGRGDQNYGAGTGPTYLAGTVQDITERKLLEEQLRQSQKMEAIGQLAGGVAHDFNNILTIITGYSELLLTQLPPDDPMSESVKAIWEAGERAGSLTRQLLAFSRKSLLDPKVLDLNSVISDAAKMLRRLIGNEILLALDLEPKLNRVKVDPGQFSQILMNMAVNARDAMPTGGKISIETCNVQLNSQDVAAHPDCVPGDYVMVAIKDTGCGMTSEVKVHIFEPFFTTKGVDKGTGLGLAVAFGIVKQSGGSIEVESESGLGTTFKIYLPAVAEQITVPKKLDSGTDIGGTETILLVEDEDGVRELAFHVLQNKGYHVLEASNGMDAMHVVEKHRGHIDLLVTDVVMPGMSGRELADVLQSHFPPIKVLFTSGYAEVAVVRHGIQHEEVMLLQKPYSPASLATTVRRILDARR